MLVQSIAEGVYDFFSLPITGARDSGVGGFIYGLGRGFTSLILRISEGSLTSVSDLSTSVARNMDSLSLDPEHIRTNKIRLWHQPEHIQAGLMRGLQVRTTIIWPQ